MSGWWEQLTTPAQKERYSGLIDSRVRLLGDSYGNATEYVRANQQTHVMEARQVVTLAELHEMWMRPDVTTMGVDDRRNVRWVKLPDGSEYEAKLL